MTSAEKQVITYLIYDGGCDCCKKCAYESTVKCCYIDPETGCYDEHRELDDDSCIEGMVKYFEQQEVKK